MSNHEYEFYSQLSPEEAELFEKLVTSRRGLGMVGCKDCRLPGVLDPVASSELSSYIISTTFDQLCHYAIEMNSLKGPDVLRFECTDSPKRDYVATLFARLGLPDQAAEHATEVFEVCVVCPHPLTVTGENVTFEEVQATIVALRGMQE